MPRGHEVWPVMGRKWGTPWQEDLGHHLQCLGCPSPGASALDVGSGQHALQQGVNGPQAVHQWIPHP